MIRFRQHIENTMLPPRNQAATVLHRPPTVKEGALAFAYAHCIDHAVLRLGCTDTKSGFLDTNRSYAISDLAFILAGGEKFPTMES